MSDASGNRERASILPAAPGVGYKSRHFKSVIDSPGAVAWLEIHAENYMGEGGRPIAQLEKLREDFPISCHGVGLSIGGVEPLDTDHLKRLRDLVTWLEPAAFSEHLAWSTHDGKYFADLLPLPYTGQTLKTVCEHIEQVQEAVGMNMLLENPSNYLEFEESEMDETEFLERIATRTGCGLLLDLNNVFVSSTNRGVGTDSYISRFPMEFVGEIHLGGHEADVGDDSQPLLIDNHSAQVADPVWELFENVVHRIGAKPTLVEWDNDVPDWSVLAAEAGRAAVILGDLQKSAA